MKDEVRPFVHGPVRNTELKAFEALLEIIYWIFSCGVESLTTASLTYDPWAAAGKPTRDSAQPQDHHHHGGGGLSTLPYCWQPFLTHISLPLLTPLVLVLWSIEGPTYSFCCVTVIQRNGKALMTVLLCSQDKLMCFSSSVPHVVWFPELSLVQSLSSEKNHLVHVSSKMSVSRW